MEALKIKRDDIYRIPVVDIYGNDNGDFLEFDLQDISLTFRCIKSLEEVEKIKKETEAKELEILSRENEEGKYISKNAEDILKMWEKAFVDMRKAMDLFLGEGACEKIFKDKNYINMYDDLSQVLDPYIEEMGLSFDKAKNQIKDKYSSKGKKVI